MGPTEPTEWTDLASLRWAFEAGELTAGDALAALPGIMTEDAISGTRGDLADLLRLGAALLEHEAPVVAAELWPVLARVAAGLL